MNAIKQFKNGNSQSTIEHARAISKQLGMRSAAGFLRNNGFSVEASLFVLLGV